MSLPATFKPVKPSFFKITNRGQKLHFSSFLIPDRATGSLSCHLHQIIEANCHFFPWDSKILTILFTALREGDAKGMLI
ncbi:hypothetical protein A0O34_00005 [Chryseobacterium glaciei]|uniref:Uncharacterized protein n=1 Tax=Chryseobacterium glaciei TaxID=1685010 RepID=A0A172Y149_9FLAO|nr:hypothetical protein A0O34_00005 [Chryseobacterium glaciei]